MKCEEKSVQKEKIYYQFIITHYRAPNTFVKCHFTNKRFYFVTNQLGYNLFKAIRICTIYVDSVLIANY